MSVTKEAPSGVAAITVNDQGMSCVCSTSSFIDLRKYDDVKRQSLMVLCIDPQCMHEGVRVVCLPDLLSVRAVATSFQAYTMNCCDL